MNIDVETEKAAAMLYSLGSLAAVQASEHANRESLNGNHEQAAYWRRVMALILGVALRRSILGAPVATAQSQLPHEAMLLSERPAT